MSRVKHSGLRRQTIRVTAAMSPYAVTYSNYRLYVDATAGPVTIQLPAAASLVERAFEVKKVDPTANTVTILPAGGQTIDGAGAAVLTLQGASLTVASDPTLPGFRSLDFALPGGLGLTKWGRVAIVDDVNGNDTTGAFNGPPFKTVQAANAVAPIGSLIYVLPGTYTLPAAGITVATQVTIKGVSREVVTLTAAVVANATLITMSNSAELEDLFLALTSAIHVDLTGILFPGVTPGTARVRNCDITVSNVVAAAGTSNVRAIRSLAGASPADGGAVVQNCNILVSSTRLGSKRGILSDTGAGTLNVEACVIRVQRNGGPVEGTYYGVETSSPGTCELRECVVRGDTADISRTTGTLTLRGTQLVNQTTNGLGFTALLAAAQVLMGDPGAVVAGATRFLKPGTATATVAETRVRAPQCLIRRISVRSQSGPGAARTDTWTLRKNGVDTLLAVSLTGAAIAASANGVAIPFNGTGDDYSIKIVTAVGSTTSDYVVALEVY